MVLDGEDYQFVVILWLVERRSMSAGDSTTTAPLDDRLAIFYIVIFSVFPALVVPSVLHYLVGDRKGINSLTPAIPKGLLMEDPA